MINILILINRPIYVHHFYLTDVFVVVVVVLVVIGRL